MTPFVLDVGANCGDYALSVLEFSPDARVFSFEPQASCQALFKISLKGKATLLHMALGAKNGTAWLSSPQNDTASEHGSLDAGALSSLTSEKLRKEKVKVETVDRMISRLNIYHVSLLKIDTEGFEWEVLMGASNALRRRKIDAIQFEFNAHHAYANKFIWQFQDFLQGYEIYRLLPNGLLPVKGLPPHMREIFAFSNYLAVLPEIRAKLDLRIPPV